jgi:hypothetical protein
MAKIGDKGSRKDTKPPPTKMQENLWVIICPDCGAWEVVPASRYGTRPSACTIHCHSEVFNYLTPAG